ncbi:beta-galactosidase [Cryomyces antarcticus]
MPHRTNWDEVASTTSDHQHRDGKDATFYKGLDLSSVATLEERGVVYKDTQRNNRTRPVEDILGDGGMDTVRLRCDHAIVATPNSRPQVRASPRRAARPTSTTTSPTTGPTPGHNDAPLAWPTDLAGLSSTLRACVKDTLVAFAKGGVDLSLVSLGDEMRNGMLWPLGRVDVDLAPAARVANLSNLATLYASARGGVDDALQAGFRRPQATIHIDNGWDETLQEAWFGALTATGRASRRDWDIKRVHDVVRIVKAVPNGLGQGVNYWKPAWSNNTGLGSSCQDAILFDADWSRYPAEVVGCSRPSIKMFKDV